MDYILYYLFIWQDAEVWIDCQRVLIRTYLKQYLLNVPYTGLALGLIRIFPEDILGVFWMDTPYLSFTYA